MPYLSLKIFKQKRLIKTKIFTDDQISIGSSEGLTLQLEGVSPWHLLIEKKYNIFYILDLESETGTFLNGQRITNETPISSGAFIGAGPYEIQFFIGPPIAKRTQALKTTGTNAPTTKPYPPSKQTQAPEHTQTSFQQPIPQPTHPTTQQTQAPEHTQTSFQQPIPQPTHPTTQQTQVPEHIQTDFQPIHPPTQQTQAPEHTQTSFQQPIPQTTHPTTQQTQVPEHIQTDFQPIHPPTEQTQVTTKEDPKSPEIPSLDPNFDKETSSFQKVSKPSKKGYWKTYAPLSKTKNLDETLEPSIGNLIEVIVCWKERILRVHHFSKGGDVFIGGKKNCQIKFPNMLRESSYKLLTIASGAKIYLRRGIKGLLFQGKEKAKKTVYKLKENQIVMLKPYEMVKLNFPHLLTVYIRLMSKPNKIPFTGLLNLRFSETLALFLAFLLTGLLVFYSSLYAPIFLTKDVDFIEKNIIPAKVIFKKPPKPPTKVVKYEMSDKTKRASIKKKKPRIVRKRPSVKSIKKLIPKKQKQVKRLSTPRKGKKGKMAAQAPGKKPQKKKITVGSVRPGGSLKTGKKGSSAKTVTPDPTKIGLVGAFSSGGGKLSKLDKAATGSGGLLGLAAESTGFAGTEEAYEGEGVGTKTKEVGSGGRGSSLVGISGIKTKGKGFANVGTGVGGVGKRGRLRMEFGTEDINVTGEIDRAAIFRVLKNNQSRFDRCYQLGLNEKPSAQGTLHMQWLISSSGKGQNARVIRDPIGSRKMVNCVANILEGLNFPSPPSGQIPKVNFPFGFYL